MGVGLEGEEDLLELEWLECGDGGVVGGELEGDFLGVIVIDEVGVGGFAGGADGAFGGGAVGFAEDELKLVWGVGLEGIPAGLDELDIFGGEAEDPGGGVGGGNGIGDLAGEDLGEHIFSGAEWEGLIEFESEAEAGVMFVFDDEEAVEHARAGASVAWSAIGRDGESAVIVGDFDVVRGFDAFESEVGGLTENGARDGGGFVVPCEAAAPAGEPWVAANGGFEIEEFDIDFEDGLDSVESGDLSCDAELRAVGRRGEGGYGFDGGEDGAGFEYAVALELGVGEVSFSGISVRLSGDGEFAFEAEVCLLADAISALSVEGDGLNTSGAVAELNFEVFVTEQEWFGELWFAAGWGSGWVWRIGR